MDRLSLKNIVKNNQVSISKTDEMIYCVLDGNDFNNKGLKITLEDDANVNLLLVNYKNNFPLDIELKEGSSLKIEGLLLDEQQSLNITANLGKFAKITSYFADLSSGDNKSKVVMNLNGENSSAFWKLASVTEKKDKKVFDVSIIHNASKTYGVSDNYGVTKDEGFLSFSGISHIKNGSKFSKTRQNAKIIVFDKLSNAKAQPILKIDENEVEASHGASVGTVNEDQIFYLTSRGLKEEMARQLITLGYLKPILNGFSDEEIKEEISTLIEGRM